MWQFISAFVQAQFVKILEIAAIAGAVAAILLGFKKAGENLAKMEEQKATIKSGEQRNEIEARNRADSADIRASLHTQRDLFKSEL